MFESLPGLSLVLEPNAPRYTIVAVSDDHGRATGLKREDILGRPVFEVFPDNPADPRSTSVRNLRESFDRVAELRVADKMPIQKYDVRNAGFGPDFEERWWCIVNSPVLGPDGEVAYIINRAEEVTQLVRLRAADVEQRRRNTELGSEVSVRTRELEESNRQLNHANEQMTELLGMISHDLRSPLGTILLSAELMRSPGEPKRPPSDAADVIARAAKRMERLIQDLLDVSRMEAGAFAVEAARVPVGELISEAIEQQRERAACASIELRVEVAEDVRDLWADRHRLQQVLENLIGNALKFTGKGGVVTVGAKSSDGEVLFWTSDTGPGIPAESQPHVFDRFWRAHEGERGGAGLGLTIVKGIVEAHGARVWVESVPGRGCTFFFTMPTAAHGEESHPAHA